MVTPNALVSLSAKNDLINTALTPAIPTSIVVKLLASVPGTTGTAAAPQYTVCDPSFSNGTLAFNDPSGMLAWGSTLEPSASPGTYGVVNVPFKNADFLDFGPLGETSDLISVCGFLKTNGTGYGTCNSCALGALGGKKN